MKFLLDDTRRRVLRIILVALLAVFGGLSVSAPALGDSVGEEYSATVFGNVKIDGEPIAGVRIVVDGGGYTAETVTDSDGRWSIGVPEVRNYNVTLDESTLPEGISVLEGGATQEVEFGLTDRVAKNFFIGEGERNETSIFDQIVSRFIYGINFGLMLGLAAVGVSLVFGTTGLSNFSHGEMVTFGA
ncbi:MAG: branched-chain amino acid ABC transporter permease, partial [Aquiluna sp.]